VGAPYGMPGAQEARLSRLGYTMTVTSCTG